MCEGDRCEGDEGYGEGQQPSKCEGDNAIDEEGDRRGLGHL